jgi:hypothetical protein
MANLSVIVKAENWDGRRKLDCRGEFSKMVTEHVGVADEPQR